MNYLFFLLKGLLIGLIVGFPSGPIGFIYMKRAATDGFWAGFMSGIGSCFAHLAYAVVLLFGYSKILNIYDNYSNTLTFIFSFFLITLGIIIYYSNKKKGYFNKDIENLYGYFISAFGITLTNPMEIIQFSFLFALLGVFEGVLFEYILLILGITIGSIFWPTITSLGISKIRHTLSNKNIMYFQKLTGLIIIITGLSFVLKGLIW